MMLLWEEETMLMKVLKKVLIVVTSLNHWLYVEILPVHMSPSLYGDFWPTPWDNKFS